MGYLDNSSITVDAILTKKGRELLAQGRDSFKITQFALADDEVDYDLYNPGDSRGSAYWGAIIEAMPLTEALPDETQVMKYKLITLPSTQTFIPQLIVNGTSNPSFTSFTNLNTAPVSITPGVQQVLGANSRLGYTATLASNTYFDIRATTGPTVETFNTATQFLSDTSLPAGQSQSVVGLVFSLSVKIPSAVAVGSRFSTTLSIVGNETGGNLVIPVSLEIKSTQIL